MYLKNDAKKEFEHISEETGGHCYYLDVDSQEAADNLTTVISTAVLENIGGGGAEG